MKSGEGHHWNAKTRQHHADEAAKAAREAAEAEWLVRLAEIAVEDDREP